MIDIQTHRRIMLSILKDIFMHREISAILGFKGGTALYFFHDLPRFSTDLDFNLLVERPIFKSELITDIIKNYIEIKDYDEKRETFVWEGFYAETYQKVKIEISKRNYPDEYEIRDLYGLSVRCLEKSYLFAHKLCAIMDRKFMANRDLFDCHFMFKNKFKIADNIIKLRTKFELKEYFEKLINYIPKNINGRGMLDGLGEILDNDQKKWAKQNLVKELLFYLKSYF